MTRSLAFATRSIRSHPTLRPGAMRTLLGALLAFAGIFLATVPARADTLVIGTVGKDTKDELKEFRPLVDYLQERLASSGVDKVEVLVLPTAAKMAEAIRKGGVHLYIESPLVAAKVARESGAVPFLRRWKKGTAEYWGEIVVRSDGPIQSLQDLRGHVIAFEDPDSTSGHLLPRALLVKAGLGLQVLKRTDESFDQSKVGAVFTMSDRAAILALLNGRVAAIGTDPSYVRVIEAERPGAVRSIAKSVVVPRHVVLHAPAMPAHRVRLIAETLAGMERSDEGRRVLQLFGKTDRFDAFPQGAEATFKPIYDQLQLIEAELTPAPATH